MSFDNRTACIYSKRRWFTVKRNEVEVSQKLMSVHRFCSRYGGRTNTQAAIQTLYNGVFRSDRGDRNGVENIAIIVTDGGSNVQRQETVRRAQEAKNRGMHELYD